MSAGTGRISNKRPVRSTLRGNEGIQDGKLIAREFSFEQLLTSGCYHTAPRFEKRKLISAADDEVEQLPKSIVKSLGSVSVELWRSEIVGGYSRPPTLPAPDFAVRDPVSESNVKGRALSQCVGRVTKGAVPISTHELTEWQTRTTKEVRSRKLSVPRVKLLEPNKPFAVFVFKYRPRSEFRCASRD